MNRRALTKPEQAITDYLTENAQLRAELERYKAFVAAFDAYCDCFKGPALPTFRRMLSEEWMRVTEAHIAIKSSVPPDDECPQEELRRCYEFVVAYREYERTRELCPRDPLVPLSCPTCVGMRQFMRDKLAALPPDDEE